MGVDVTFVVGREIGWRPDDVIAALRGTDQALEQIWERGLAELCPDYRDYGLKRASVSPWRRCAGDEIEENPAPEKCNVWLDGPRGFSAVIHGDSVAFDHGMRWGIATGDSGCRQCLVASAALFARALNAPRVVFLPDSGADVSVCVDLLWEGQGFDRFFARAAGFGLDRFPYKGPLDLYWARVEAGEAAG